MRWWRAFLVVSLLFSLWGEGRFGFAAAETDEEADEDVDRSRADYSNQDEDDAGYDDEGEHGFDGDGDGDGDGGDYADEHVCAAGDSLCEAEALAPKGANAQGAPPDAKECVDRHEACVGFAASGECENNPGWMIINCPVSCNACHMRDPKIRCAREALNMTLTPVYAPGDMQDMFESIIERFGDRYELNVLSTDPYVITFDNFLTNAEAKALISTVKKWERSTDTGSSNEFGEVGRILSSGRTSSNSWCNSECEEHPDVQTIIGKIEEVTRVPRDNYESFQVLRYETGQKYVTHHDYGHEEVELACGPRVLTFFLYLSDVEEGGETNFPLLNIAVKPKKGRALLWPSVLSQNPEQQDSRTMHEAKPVLKGRKFAANSWIHLYDYVRPNLWGCTGAFDEL